MFVCFIDGCPTVFEFASTYIDHLHNDHRTPTNYRYVCTSFKRHCFRHEPSASSAGIEAIEQAIKQEHPGHTTLHENTFGKVESTNHSNDQTLIQNDFPLLSKNINYINQAAVAFTLELHKETNISRADVLTIQRKTSNLNAIIVEKIEESITVSDDPQTAFELRKYLERAKQPFDFIDTDYTFFKHIEEQGIFRFPLIVTIDKDLISIKASRYKDTGHDRGYMVMMDVEHQLRAFFSCDKILKDTIENTKRLEKQSVVSYIVNAKIWKTIKNKYPDDILIPISLYSDEFEVNDCLSSHNKRHVICGTYYSVPTMPVQHRSKLCNIFVAAMMRKVQIKEVGVSKLFEIVIQRFQKLEEEGITFHVNQETFKVRFILSMIQGDNLGLHQLHQFMGFNSNFYCRFCTRSREQCQKDTDEIPAYVRTVESYNEDVKTNRPSETGVRGESVFNQLPGFHAVENLYVDAMHDFFSNGVCTFGLIAILNYCIFQKQYVSLSKFNAHKTFLSKTALDSSLIRMPDLTETFVSQTKSKTVVIRATASELKAFTHYFTFILGPFVPKADPVWQYCKVLIKITDKILSPSFNEQDLDELRSLCSEHHKQYQSLFNLHLKPKQHFMCHYSSVIRMSGSVASMMNFRYEAKHKCFKEYAGVISSRKNICYTLCVKASLQFSHDVFHKVFFRNAIEGTVHSCDFQLKSYVKQLSKPFPIQFDKDVKETVQVKYKGTLFKIGTYVTVTEELNVKLFEIIDLLISDTVVFIIGLLWIVGEYDEHFLAYEIEEKSQTYSIINIDDVDGPPIMPHTIGCMMYIRKKQDFSTMDV